MTRGVAADGSRRMAPGMVKPDEPVLVRTGLMNITDLDSRPMRAHVHVTEELEDSPQLPVEEAIRQAPERVGGGEIYPPFTSDAAEQNGRTAGNGAVVRRPELDSNQRPTP